MNLVSRLDTAGTLRVAGLLFNFLEQNLKQQHVSILVPYSIPCHQHPYSHTESWVLLACEQTATTSHRTCSHRRDQVLLSHTIFIVFHGLSMTRLPLGSKWEYDNLEETRSLTDTFHYWSVSEVGAVLGELTDWHCHDQNKARWVT